MIHIRQDNNTICATDILKNSIRIHVRDWKHISNDLTISRTTHQEIHGTATGIEFPQASLVIGDPDNTQWTPLTNKDLPVTTDNNKNLIKIEAQIALYVKFEGDALVSHSQSGNITIQFASPTPVAIGFKSRAQVPDATLTVPRTAAGVATVLSHVSAAIEVTNPDKSYPSLRNYPPLIAFGDTIEIPDTVATNVPDTGIELHLPTELRALIASAPLAYYLGATVEVRCDQTPQIVANDINFAKGFNPQPSYQKEANDFFKQVFFLDCLVREAGPYPTGLADGEIHEILCFDPRDAYHATPAERLEMYSQIHFDELAPHIPTWHLSFYLAPTYDNTLALPHILDRMALSYTADASQVDRSQIVTRSVEEAYTQRAASPTRSTHQPFVALSPEFRDSHMQGWLGQGVPVDGFKATPRAFLNRFQHLSESDDPLDLTVVLNDLNLQDEPKAVTRIYNNRSRNIPIEVNVRRTVSVNQLAEIFETPGDLIHFIGHCENSGLKCSNGYLAVDSIAECKVTTFFLNSCNSFHEGLSLVEKGAVGGVVTLSDVIDEHATQVGTPFAKLLIHGYSIEQALQIAKPNSIVNKMYTTVGDGTFTLSQGTDTNPPIVFAQRTTDTDFRVELYSYPPDCFGTCFHGLGPIDTDVKLSGNPIAVEQTTDEFLAFLHELESPVIMDDTMYWPAKLIETLS